MDEVFSLGSASAGKGWETGMKSKRESRGVLGLPRALRRNSEIALIHTVGDSSGMGRRLGIRSPRGHRKGRLRRTLRLDQAKVSLRNSGQTGKTELASRLLLKAYSFGRGTSAWCCSCGRSMICGVASRSGRTSRWQGDEGRGALAGS
jgi:hypothetical protein